MAMVENGVALLLFLFCSIFSVGKDARLRPLEVENRIELPPLIEGQIGAIL